jgi:Domain of unknown function (DUF6458)
VTIGASLFLIAVGAILRFAVSDTIEGIDLTTIGLILMIVGVVGLVIGLWQTERFSRSDRVVREDVPPPADRRY